MENTASLNKEEIFEAVKVAYNAVADKMGEDILVLDISGVSIISDYFIIASANNANQLKAIAEHVEEKLAMNSIFIRHVEGVQTARWILMDFGYIIVHLFCKEEREYYRLEKLWGDARHILHDELL
ncbi:MAG: ribosome silencing factor [Clostridiales bacterium]|jgi:ribosome-associated protein|nr:ribosome silencing factor [Clostridiales bacterium]